MGWSRAFRREGPAKASTPTPPRTIDKALGPRRPRRKTHLRFTRWVRGAIDLQHSTPRTSAEAIAYACSLLPRRGKVPDQHGGIAHPACQAPAVGEERERPDAPWERGRSSSVPYPVSATKTMCRR